MGNKFFMTEKNKVVLVTDYAWPDLAIEKEKFAAHNLEIVAAKSGEEAELISLAEEHDPVAIMTNWQIVSPAVIDAAPACRVIARYGVGVDNIAVDYAQQKGIVVTNVPDYCFEEVADHVFGFILALARNIVPLVANTRTGEWNLHASPRPFARLKGQTVGIIGFGLIGRAVAKRAAGFGLQVQAYTPRLSPADVSPGVTVAADLPSLLANSDYVSLNVPANAETERMVDELFLAQMKPSAYLINTSRGAVVDENALLRALKDGTIRGAALDVLNEEKAGSGNPLLELDNVLITPHAAFYSPAAIEELQHKAAEQVIKVLGGEEPDYEVKG